MVREEWRNGELGPRPFFSPTKDKDMAKKKTGRRGTKQAVGTPRRATHKKSVKKKKPLPTEPTKDDVDEILDEVKSGEAEEPVSPPAGFQTPPTDTAPAPKPVPPAPKPDPGDVAPETIRMPEPEPEPVMEQEPPEPTPPPAPAPAAPVSAPKPPPPPVTGVRMPKAPGVNVAPPAAPPPAAKKVEIEDAFDYETAYRFAFLGSGQGGGRMAHAFYKEGYRRVGVFNTAEADFEGLDEAIPRYHLGIGGARKDPEYARTNLRGHEEEVRDLLLRSWGSKVDYGMVCAGLGGGTGSGTLIELVKIAQQHMEETTGQAKVGAVISLPSADEGMVVCKNAVRALDSLLSMQVSPLIIVDNERINQLYQPSMAMLYETANTLVAQLLHLFNQLAAVHSEYITFDRSEFGQLLDGGIVVFGCGDIPNVQSTADVSEAVKAYLSGGILAEVDLQKAGLAACLFVADEDTLNQLSMDYFAAGFTTVDRTLRGGNGLLHRGVYLGANPGLQCYTMLSSLPPPKDRVTKLAKKGQVTEANGGLAEFLNIG